LSVVTLMVARYGLLLMNWMVIVDVDGCTLWVTIDELEGDIGVRILLFIIVSFVYLFPLMF
jgi:hypothetical protein